MLWRPDGTRGGKRCGKDLTWSAARVMGTLWRVDKALEDSEGLRWAREQLGAYDWSKVDWITVRRGRSERYAFRGVCKVHLLHSHTKESTSANSF